jgi:hypothetical protein
VRLKTDFSANDCPKNSFGLSEFFSSVELGPEIESIVVGFSLESTGGAPFFKETQI